MCDCLLVTETSVCEFEAEEWQPTWIPPGAEVGEAQTELTWLQEDEI